MQVQHIAAGLNVIFAISPVMQDTYCLVRTLVVQEHCEHVDLLVRLTVQIRKQRHKSAQGNMPQHKFHINCYGFQSGPSRTHIST